MFIRTLSLIGGLAGATALSQFPEFSQQYLQRLSGAVNELRVVVAGVDLAALTSGKSRDEALESLPDDGFEGDLKRNVAQSVRRYERLDKDLASLRAASPLERLAQPWNMADSDLIQATWQDYKPAIPVTTDGLVSAGIGFGLGWLVVGAALSLLMRPFRRTRRS